MRSYLYLGLLLAGLAVGVFLFVRRKNTRFLKSGSEPLGDDVAIGREVTARTLEINRVGLDSVTANVEVTNATGLDRTVTVHFHAIPTGGLEFGLDPFEDEQKVTVPARSKTKLTFFNEDWAFAPFSTWQVEVSINGIVVDRQ